MIRTILAAALMASAALPAQAALSGAEAKMAATVDAETGRSIGLLEKLVTTNSGTLNLEGVEKVGEMMRAELAPLGFDVQWLPMKEAGRAGHIVATHKGDGKGKRMLVIGHLDTVFEPESPFQSFTRNGDIVTGPGVNDMKGGLVVIVSALRAMQAAGTLKKADIVVMLTGDEERPGSPLDKVRADLIAAGKWADAALDFETLARENGRDMGSIARRSASSWMLRTTGKPGHSSGIFSKNAGDGAIYEMARILAAFRTELPEPNLTFNVGLLAGGTTAGTDAKGVTATASGKTNVIPGLAEARGDLRTLSDEQTERVRAKMLAIVARHLPGTGAELTFAGDGYPPMAPTEGSRALLGQLNGVNRDLGLPEMAALDPLKRGAGDIGFVARDVDGLVGLGMAGEGSHAPGETADLKSLTVQAKRAAILMTRLSRETRGR
ncbi:peptidase M20 [Sphingomonas oleivorans]|uniref:Peptidase M20 n=1 Tax=Sphingomonas oleivorans TaxID=1735121 RepID=A0A2T5FXX1_9SPHN|nr:M20/M25/M40 family metallo-hydrolase [Sphingomonas oleivorans]PTQ10991.1 peptidase M20 [Sphingomonas oleivorans]